MASLCPDTSKPAQTSKERTTKTASSFPSICIVKTPFRRDKGADGSSSMHRPASGLGMFRSGQIILRTGYESSKTVSLRSLRRPQHSPETPQATTAVSRAGAERARLIRSRISMISLMVALCLLFYHRVAVRAHR